MCEGVCENLCAGINISKRSGFCSGSCEVHSEYKYPQRVSNALDVKAERRLHTLGSIVIMAQDDQIYNAHSTEKNKGPKKASK